jgi:hypothetical protein
VVVAVRVFELPYGRVDFAEKERNALRLEFGPAADAKALNTMHPLSQKIAVLQRQLVWRRRAVGACWIVATAITATFALGVIDYFVRFNDPGLRIMATGALVAAVAWATYRWWYLPQQQRLAPLAVARRVEARFPQLHDSLASAVEFLQQSEHDETAGSAQLRRLVIAEASNNVEGLPLDDVVERGPLRKATIWLATTVAVIAVCLILDASAVGTALVRLATPLGGTQWPRQHHLEFREVPTQLAAGQALELDLIDKAGNLPDDVTIEYAVSRNSGRDVSSEPMKRVGDTMVARRENVTQTFAFRAKGGDDDTMPWHLVEVKELPRLSTMSITIHPPAYSGLPTSSAERHLNVIAGTGIEVSGTTSEPIRAARILHDHGDPIAATITADNAGHEGRAFHIDPKQWIATQSGPYRLELVGEGDLAGVVGQWNLRVEPDSPPSVSWQRPADDLYVLPKAVVPIEIVVKDDLAIQRVDLTYDRNDKSESQRAARPKEPPISLYRGPDKPEMKPANDGNTRGESRVVEYSWDLAQLQLPAGAVLTVEAEAGDYRPGIGRTVGPRRFSIITADELETRLADRQLQIARQLERALVIERKTREDVNRLQIQLRDAGGFTQRDRLTLQTAEPNQKNVSRMLVDPAEGVPPLAGAILNEIATNRLENSEMSETMNRLAAELKRLSTGPLSDAERELTSSRKAVESISPNKDAAENIPLPITATQLDALSRLLGTVANSQDDVIATLERLVSELSGKTDYRRLVRQITELREDQIAHEKTTRGEIGVESLPLEISELSRAQRANLNKAAAGQTAIAGRFAKIEQNMDQLARQLTDDRDAMAGTLSDAVTLSRQRSIGTHMQQTATDLSENRVGQALEREHHIADDLQQLLSLLRNEGERRPQELVDKLKQAEQKLNALQQQLAQLRQQVAQAERAPNPTNPEQLRKLSDQQQKVQHDIEQLARELDRLQAAEASKSAQSAANDLNNRPAGQKKGEPSAGRPSSSEQVKKAEQNLEQAKSQLAQRRQQAEDDLQLEIVRRFQTELGEMVKRQQSVLKNTIELDAATRPPAALSTDQIKIVADLAGQERQLADQAKEHSELLFGLGAVRVSLEEAERRLAAAGKLLEDKKTDSPTREAEQLALTRLEGMLQTFAQTANEAAKKPDANNPPPPPAANNQPPPPQRRPTFELLEVKMLRMLQADLNDRTSEHEKHGAAAAGNPAAKAGFDKEARELAAEQGGLVELVQKMLSRDNEQQQQQ